MNPNRSTTPIPTQPNVADQTRRLAADEAREDLLKKRRALNNFDRGLPNRNSPRRSA